MNKTYTVRALSEYLGISKEWIYLHKEELPYVRFGTSIRFFKKDIDDYVERNKNCLIDLEPNSSYDSLENQETGKYVGVRTVDQNGDLQKLKMRHLQVVSSQTS